MARSDQCAGWTSHDSVARSAGACSRQRAIRSLLRRKEISNRTAARLRHARASALHPSVSTSRPRLEEPNADWRWRDECGTDDAATHDSGFGTVGERSAASPVPLAVRAIAQWIVPNAGGRADQHRRRVRGLSWLIFYGSETDGAVPSANRHLTR